MHAHQCPELFRREGPPLYRYRLRRHIPIELSDYPTEHTERTGERVHPLEGFRRSCVYSLGLTLKLIYAWSERISSLGRTRLHWMRDAIAGTMNVSSTMDSPCSLTHVFAVPLSATHKPVAVAQSSMTSPFIVVLGKPQAGCLSLKSPSTMTCIVASRLTTRHCSRLVTLLLGEKWTPTKNYLSPCGHHIARSFLFE